MGEGRNVYADVKDRHVIRTEDVYQMETEEGVAGYSDTLLSVVANFKNSGIPEGTNAQCMIGKSKRGEVALRLFAVIDPATETFLRVGFKSRGCLAMTACASMVSMMLEGMTLDEALALEQSDIIKRLDGVPADKSYTAYFAAEAARALVGDYLVNQGLDLKQLDARVVCDASDISCVMAEHCSLRDTRLELLVQQARTKS